MTKIIGFIAVVALAIGITGLFKPDVKSLPGVQGIQGQQASSTLPKCINQIYVWSLGLSSLLAVLMVVLGGYYVMTSAGNAEQATKGKEYIWGAVIGLVLLFTAYLLLRVINPDLINLRFGNPACVKNGQKTAATTAAACKASGGDWSLFYVEPPVTNPNSQ